MHRRRAKGIDALRIVPDYRQTAPFGAEVFENGRLKGVGVLIFIDEDRVKPVRDIRRQRRILHQVEPVEEQVVVIENALLLLALSCRHGKAS